MSARVTRGRSASALAVVAALALLVVLDGPTTLRLPLAVVTVTCAVGLPVVDLLQLPRSAARTALVIGTSLTLSLLVAEVLVLAGSLDEVTGVVVLLGVTAPAAAFNVVRARESQPPPQGTRAPVPLRALVRPVALTSVALLLWITSAVLVEPRDAGALGMISALPVTWWVGLAVLTAAFFMHIRLGVYGPFGVAQLGVLIAFLYGLMTVAEPYSRIPTSYTHVGLVDYIVRDHEIMDYFDGRYSWPGSLSLGAMVTQLAGAASSAALVRWAIPVFVALWAVAVFALASAFGTSRRVAWVAVWVFVALNWVGQDYWSSQALHFLLVLIATSTVATWFQRRERRGRSAGFLPDHAVATAVGLRERGGLFALLVAMALAVASGHQLSPFMLLGMLTVLWIVDGRDIRLLPLITLATTFLWFSWGAEAYWVNHLGPLTENVGEVGAIVTAGTTGRVGQGSTARQVVLATRVALSVAAWGGAAACFAFVRKTVSGSTTVAALAAVPFGAVALQGYGGELGLRIFLFSLPFVALLLAEGCELALRARWRRPAIAGAVGAVSVAVASVAFVVARYGNEQFEQVYPEDVAAVQEFYRLAPPDAYVFANNTSNPFRMGPYNDYRPNRFAELAHPRTIDVRETLRTRGADEGYILVMEAGINEAILREGSDPNWYEMLDRELKAFGAQERFRQRRAVLYEFEVADAADPPRRPEPARSLASPEIRRLLDVPALALSVALTTAMVVFGVVHVVGRGRSGRGDAVFAVIATAVIGAFVVARLLALT